MPILRLLVTALTVMLGACQHYEVSVNERVLYTPRNPLEGVDIADPALRDCLEQAARDAGISSPAGLKRLNCSSAGIERLDGISVFTGLEWINFEGNRIRNLVELAQISGITRLQLADNRIVDPVPLAALGALESLDLSGNTTLQCPTAGALARLVEITLPAHCENGTP